MQLVSAVLTTHNRKLAIVERALVSILNQTYPHIEVIVVDDSSPDYVDRNEIEVLVSELTKNQAHYIRHKTNIGACAARNTGMENATGEFIAFLDDDDEWLPNKIEQQISKFNDPRTALVYCGSQSVNDIDGIIQIRNTLFFSGNVYDKLMRANFIGSTSFPLIRKKYLEEIGGFDVEMQSSQDYDVWLRLAKKYPVEYVPEPLVVYHKHIDERISMNPYKRLAGKERINLKNAKFISEHDDVWWYRHISLTPYYAKTGLIKKAFLIWMRAALRCPGKVSLNLKYLLRIIKSSILFSLKRKRM